MADFRRQAPRVRASTVNPTQSQFTTRGEGAGLSAGAKAASSIATGLSGVFGEVASARQEELEAAQEAQENRKLSSFLLNLTDVSGVQQESEQEFTGRQRREMGRTARMLDLAERQKPFSRRGDARRVSAFRKFVENNPTLGPDAEKLFRLSVGEGVVQSAMSLEEERDARLKQVRETINTLAKENDIDPTLTLTEKYEQLTPILNRKRRHDEAIQTLAIENAEIEMDEHRAASHFRQNILPHIADQARGFVDEIRQLDITSMSPEEKQANLDELRNQFSRWKEAYARLYDVNPSVINDNMGTINDLEERAEKWLTGETSSEDLENTKQITTNREWIDFTQTHPNWLTLQRTLEVIKPVMPLLSGGRQADLQRKLLDRVSSFIAANPSPQVGDFGGNIFQNLRARGASDEEIIENYRNFNDLLQTNYDNGDLESEEARNRRKDGLRGLIKAYTKEWRHSPEMVPTGVYDVMLDSMSDDRFLEQIGQDLDPEVNQGIRNGLNSYLQDFFDSAVAELDRFKSRRFASRTGEGEPSPAPAGSTGFGAPVAAVGEANETAATEELVDFNVTRDGSLLVSPKEGVNDPEVLEWTRDFNSRYSERFGKVARIGAHLTGARGPQAYQSFGQVILDNEAIPPSTEPQDIEDRLAGIGISPAAYEETLDRLVESGFANNKQEARTIFFRTFGGSS